jgi:hypothetical protein
MHWVQAVGRGRALDVVEVKKEEYQTRSDLFKALRPNCGFVHVSARSGLASGSVCIYNTHNLSNLF